MEVADTAGTINNGGTGDNDADLLDGVNNFLKLADACILDGELVQAMEHITKAIELNPPDEISALLYYRRAGVHLQLKNWSKVVEDSTAAIEKRRGFSLAFFRRFEGNKAEGNLDDALQDLVHVSCLSGAQPEVRAHMEELLLSIGRLEAQEQFKFDLPKTPSNLLVQTLLEDSSTDPITKWWRGEKVAEMETISADSGQQGFQGAIAALLTRDYTRIIELCTEELENESSSFKDEALLLRGTFLYLFGFDKDKYLSDFDRVIDSSTAGANLKTSAWIKKGRAFAQKLRNKEEVAVCFDKAEQLSPNNADVYFQHSNAIIDAVDENEVTSLIKALEYAKRALELRPDFSYAAALSLYLELSIALTKKNEKEMMAAVVAIEKCVIEFPTSPFVQNVRGHIYKQLSEQYASYASFKQASELEPENLAYRGQAIVASYAISDDHETAVNALNKILELEDKSSAIYEQIASVQHLSGDINGALENVTKGLKVCFSMQDYVSLCSLKKAIEVHHNFKSLIQDSEMHLTLANLMLG